MNAQLIKETLKSLFAIQRTVCLESSPGTGKTSVVHQVAKELKVPCVEIHMPTMLVEDFGILFPEGKDGRLTYRIPDWFPVAGQAPDAGILLFDDRNQASADLQKVLANICQARTLHGAKLPDGWMVVSTGNRKEDRAGANRVLSHLRNRETVLPFDVSAPDWTAWAIENDIAPEVVSFIQYRPDLLNDFDPQRDMNPTARAWSEGVSPLIARVPAAAMHACVAGAVGEGPAAEFMGFLRVYQTLPDIQEVFKNPGRAPVPEDPVTVYALVGAIAYNMTVKNMAAACEYLKRVSPEFGVLAMRLAIKRDDKLTSTEAFVNWTMENQDLVM